MGFKLGKLYGLKIIPALLLVNLRRAFQKRGPLPLLLGLLSVLFLFAGTPLPVHAADLPPGTYGQGRIKARLYTDYFCGPCSAVEPQLEPLLLDLVKRNVITITFVDVPIHGQTPLYARYFLYAIHRNHDLAHALKVRGLLFQAARENILDEKKLVAYLYKQKIPFKAFDTKEAVRTYNEAIREDRISATPTMTLYRSIRKESFSGASDILKAFQELK